MSDPDPKALIGIYVVLGIIWTFYNSTSGFFRAVSENARRNNMTGWLIVGAVIAVFLWPIGLAIAWFAAFRGWQNAGKGGNDGSSGQNSRS